MQEWNPIRRVRLLISLLTLVFLALAPRAFASSAPDLDAGFRRLYELNFPAARAQFSAWQQAHPGDPLGAASEAASYLFEEFYHQGVLTSEFFLDDKRLLGGITGKPDQTRRKEFLAAIERAQQQSRQQLAQHPRDPNALFALTISIGMLADYLGILEKRQLDSLRYLREAERHAKDLLAVRPDSADAYLALGAANYIIGCLPTHTRFFLWFGGIHGDKPGGMKQLQMAAERGHYLAPFAKTLLALAALREKQYGVARANFQALVAEFPQNPLFTRELAKLNRPAAGASSR
jgi:hypothetical protein